MKADLTNMATKPAEEERLPVGAADPEDYKVILQAILRQAMDDYIKLQHPKFRSKKYLEEAFSSAVDMLFDSDYQFLYLKDEYGEPLNLKELITFLLEDNRAQLNKLKEHVIQEARDFWETKLVRTLYIPNTFVYDGHVYTVNHTDDTDYSIDFEKKEIYLNKKSTSESEQAFTCIAIKILFYHEEIPAKEETRDTLGKGLFRMLKINSCFTGS